MNIEKELIKKTIVNATVNGYEIILIFSDNTIFSYSASDGGYSEYDISNLKETKQ